MKEQNETPAEQDARWAEAYARKRHAEMLSDMVSSLSAAFSCRHWDDAERMAKILAILLASEPK